MPSPGRVHQPTDKQALDLTNLLERAQAGDKQALQLLVEPICDVLGRLALRHLPPLLRRLFDPEDLVQDIRLALHIKGLPVEVFASQQRFLGYVREMIRNGALNLMRAYRRLRCDLRRDVPLPGVWRAEPEPACRQPGPLKQAQDADEWQQLTADESAAICLTRHGSGSASPLAR